MGRTLIALLFAVLSFCTFAQPDKASIEKIDGEKYYIHHVEKGNTLYSISKMYAVDISDITAANPSAADGLSIGEVLKIPLKSVDKKEAKENPLKIEGEFLIHTVERKETLFSISKKYDVEIRDIIAHNPQVKEGLQEGQQVKIPTTKVRVQAADATEPAVQDSLVVHTVAAGETLYALVKQYGVSEDSIKIVNNGLPGGLKEGEVIRIPKLTAEYLLKKEAEALYPEGPGEDDSTEMKEIYNVGVFLPFFTDINDSIKRHLKWNEEDRIYTRSLTAIEFYQGVLMAVDSMVKQGMSVKLFTYDTKNDPGHVQSLLKKPEMETLDIILGPMYRSSFEAVSAFARPRAIPMVCPVPQSNKLLLGNSHVSKICASPATQAEQLADYAIRNFQNENILLINTRKPADEPLVLMFRKKSIEVLREINPALMDSIKELAMVYPSEDLVKQRLSTEKKNVLVIPCTDQVYVTDLLTRLNNLRKNYEFIIMGAEEWQEFTNLDVEALHHLHVHFAASDYLDFDDEKVRGWVRLFREQFKTDPGKYGAIGFDVAMYYLCALKHYGTGFQKKLPAFKGGQLAIGFNFFKTGPESGYENRHVHILKYQDYKLIKVN